MDYMWFLSLQELKRPYSQNFLLDQTGNYSVRGPVRELTPVNRVYLTPMII